ncbi:MAG: oligosaccharide flippase family protein [bacterium]|jgi:lipopolysaccharide exporter
MEKTDVLYYHKFLHWCQSTSSKALSCGRGWLGVGAGEYGLRLIRNMILARILAPEAFGQLSLVLTVNTLLEAFTQFGAREAVVQSRNGTEHSYLNVTWWAGLIRGVGLFGIAFFLAPLIASFYEDRTLIPLMRVAFLSLVFNSLLSPRTFTALKNMNYYQWVMIWHGGGILGVLLAIGLGFYFQSVWALIIGFTAESAFRLIISFILCPFLPRLYYEKETLHEFLFYIKGMIGIPLVVVLYSKLDIFVLYKMVSQEQVGMYFLALSLAQIPQLFYEWAVGPIIFPSISSIQDDNRQIIALVYKATKYMIIFYIPLLTLMACTSSQLLAVLYGAEYTAVGIPFIFICTTVVIYIIGAVLSTVFLATGRPDLNRKAAVYRLLLKAILIIPLIQFAGLTGAALSGLIAVLVWFWYILYCLKDYIGFPITGYISILAKPAAISVSIFTVLYFLLNYA